MSLGYIFLVTVLILIGLMAWAGAGVLLLFRSEASRRLGLIRRTQTSRVADVHDAPAGTLVEVEGTLRWESPLTSEMAGKTCAYYRSEVDHHHQSKDRQEDDEGRPIGTQLQHVNKVLSRERFAPFIVEDDSGGVSVRAEGAEVDALEVMNRFERVGRWEKGEERGITCGGVSVNLPNPAGGRTIGYRCVESVCPWTRRSTCWGSSRKTDR